MENDSNIPPAPPIPSSPPVAMLRAYDLGNRHLGQLRLLEAAHVKSVKAKRAKHAQLQVARQFVQERFGGDALLMLDEALRSEHRRHYPRPLPNIADMARSGRTSSAAPNPANVRP